MLLAVSLFRISCSVGDWHLLRKQYFGRNAQYRFLAVAIAGGGVETAAGETHIDFRGGTAQARGRADQRADPPRRWSWRSDIGYRRASDSLRRIAHELTLRRLDPQGRRGLAPEPRP